MFSTDARLPNAWYDRDTVRPVMVRLHVHDGGDAFEDTFSLTIGQGDTRSTVAVEVQTTREGALALRDTLNAALAAHAAGQHRDTPTDAPTDTPTEDASDSDPIPAA